MTQQRKVALQFLALLLADFTDSERLPDSLALVPSPVSRLMKRSIVGENIVKKNRTANAAENAIAIVNIGIVSIACV